MAANSKIEWTEATWSVTTGCTRISDGCTHCYIDRTPPFRMAGRRFDGAHIGATTGILLHPERLAWPLKWRKPRRIFVDSLADLFHDDVPSDFIAQVFAVMAVSPQHTFQVLTKRHARMRSLLSSPDFRRLVAAAVSTYGRDPDLAQDYVTSTWPLPNVWVGVSVENEQWAKVRIPALLATPAAVRWLSCEPLLGRIHLRSGVYQMLGEESYGTSLTGIDWVVCGAESGPGARPMHPEWARFIRGQCARTGTAFFFKQWGQWAPVVDQPRYGDVWVGLDGSTRPWIETDGMMRHGLDLWRYGDEILMRRARSKHDTGRELDGRTHDEYPQVKIPAVAA